jgi:alpha-galactosidase
MERFRRFPLREGAALRMLVRTCSSFVRIRYQLEGTGARLTKKITGKDNFLYTAFHVPRGSRFTEIQLNQYAATRHAYLPQLLKRPEVDWLDKVSFAGPVLMVEIGDPKGDGRPYTLLCGYEHGGEYTDDFLAFHIDREDGGYRVSLVCGDGTYCDETLFSDDEPYRSPWFHIGLIQGGPEDMLRAYRTFLLRDMPLSAASRQPLICYDTWNYQERIYARGHNYLDHMDMEHMLREIAIAHKLGVDIFVIDTGWYRSTGDWDVDLNRFPDGLGEIGALLRRYGMKLGLWFNPTAAAVSSVINREHPEFRKQLEGRDVSLGPVWETEESFSMCLVSDYAEWFIDKMVELGERLGVRYFKWDAVDMRGCTAAHHHHGGPEASPEEREKNFRFRCGMALTHIAEELCRRIPDAIVDLDVTECRRYVGLDFISAGRFIHMNNGPYYHEFDIPHARETYRLNGNVFFYPGPARCQVARQALAYDTIIPSNLFPVHFLMDGPSPMRLNSLASMFLGGNYIWSDLFVLTKEEIAEIAALIGRYKKVARDVTEAYPLVRGFNGASPEIHEKLNPETGRGIVVFFTREPVDLVYCTQPLAGIAGVSGAEEWQSLADGRLKLRVSLGQNEARIVFCGA